MASGIVVVIVLTSLTFVSNYEGNTSHNKCLTWHDDPKALILTCRVANFELPVTFSHEKSGTHVVCEIDDPLNRHCSEDKDKSLIYVHNHTVIVVLKETKEGRDLDGEWFCTQGNHSQKTKVSLNEGIIKDAWVQLRGVTSFDRNRIRHINLQCSSCREPQDRYVEFLANGTTIGNVHRDDKGRCLYGETICSNTLCNCTSTANMFAFRYRINNFTTTFSCEMYFSDSLRNGRFSITAMERFTGKDFVVNERKTVVVKNNTVIVIEETKDNLDEKEGDMNDVGTTANIPRKDSETVTEKHKIVLATVIPAVVVIGLVTGGIIYIKRKAPTVIIEKPEVKYRQPTSNDEALVDIKTDKQEKPDHSNENISLNCSVCMRNRSADVKSDFFCFNCEQYFCNDCFQTVHEAIEAHKNHTKVKTEFIPQSYSHKEFYCKKHNDPVKYVCLNHKGTVFCEACKSSVHSNCKKLALSEHRPDYITNMIEQYISKQTELKNLMYLLEDFYITSVTLFNTHLNRIKIAYASSSQQFKLIDKTKPHKLQAASSCCQLINNDHDGNGYNAIEDIEIECKNIEINGETTETTTPRSLSPSFSSSSYIKDQLHEEILGIDNERQIDTKKDKHNSEELENSDIVDVDLKQEVQPYLQPMPKNDFLSALKVLEVELAKLTDSYRQNIQKGRSKIMANDEVFIFLTKYSEPYNLLPAVYIYLDRVKKMKIDLENSHRSHYVFRLKPMYNTNEIIVSRTVYEPFRKMNFTDLLEKYIPWLSRRQCTVNSSSDENDL